MSEPQASSQRPWSLLRWAGLTTVIISSVFIWLSFKAHDQLPANIIPADTNGAAALVDKRPKASIAVASRFEPPSQPADATAQVQAPEKAIERPGFDVVRVSPSGDAVLAGRAAPNAEVTVAGSGREIGHTQADSRGQWVLVAPIPLLPGSVELQLTSRTRDGTQASAESPVVIMAPESAKVSSSSQQGQAPIVAVLVPPNAPARILQGSQNAGPSGNASRPNLELVDYDDKGNIRFAGTAAPGSTVRVYIDNAPAGDAVVDRDGRWALVPAGMVAVGDHRLRLDQLAAAGRAVARTEFPFQRANLSPQDVAGDRVVVQPRQNLWRIARRAYGMGTQYTVIYQANRDQIRDPNLIYPGQLFSIPTAHP